MSATGSNKQVVKLGPNVNNNNNGGDHLYQFLASIQLESFLPQLRDKLQITRLSHFDYVKPKDLEKIGMSKPAIRRLLDAVSRNKKLQMPARPPPPAPSNPSSQSLAKSSVLTISKQPLSSNKLNSISANTATIQTAPIENHDSSVSQIISSSEIEFLKTKTGEDEILGTGHFGVVKKAVWMRRGGANKLTVAVKCLHHEGELNHQAFVDIVNEVSAMCNLNHPNLIKLHGIVFNSTSTTNNTGGMVMMVTELAPHGSLYAYLRKFKLEKKYPLLNQIYSFIYQIACGMEYLESKKLIHRDLAARNILLSSPEHVKICDFGMARSTASSGGQYKMNENHKIPCAWYAPESIRHKLFSSKSDVWAFGVTLWECFSLCEQPWPHLSAAEILGKLERESKRLSQPYLCSRSFYRVILSCWEYEPADRATFAALKSIIKGTRIVDMRAKDNYREDGRLEVTRGDQITIVDGCASNYWWKGQNKRTQNVGKFPRAILDPERKICGEDISMPLRNSFIHTGHMGADHSGRTWGNPGKIDDIFLRNPLKPPDLHEEEENDQEVETITVGNYKSQAQNPSKINQDVLLIDLSDSVDLKVSYPADNVSTKSLSPSLVDLAALAPFSISQSPQTQSQSYYENNQYMSERLMKNGAAEARPPPLPPTLPAAETSRVYYNDLPTREWTPPRSEEIYKPTTTNLKPTNPFYSKPIQAKMTSSQYSSNYNTSQNFTSFNNEPSVKKVDFNGTQSLSMIKTNNLTVDDLLSKVMNDVLTDFNNLKP